MIEQMSVHQFYSAFELENKGKHGELFSVFLRKRHE